MHVTAPMGFRKCHLTHLDVRALPNHTLHQLLTASDWLPSECVGQVTVDMLPGDALALFELFDFLLQAY